MALRRLRRQFGAGAEVGAELVLMRPVAEERRGDRVLHWAVRAQTAIRELLDCREDAIEPVVPADRHPAGAPAGRQVGLRQRRERDDGGIEVLGGDGRHGAVVGEIGVDLVGQERKVVPVRQIDELAPHLAGVDRAGRVVRVDDDERPGRGRDQAADVIDVGQPAAGGISAIEDRLCADLREHSCVQWIGRHRDQHFIPSFGKRSERQLNAFRRPGCDDHAVRKDRHATPRTIGGHRFARFEDTDRGRVAILSAPQRRFDGVNEVRRRLEPEDDRDRRC